MSEHDPGTDEGASADHDQDADPPTPDGREPDPAGYDPDDPTPGSHPDPPPGQQGS